MREKEMSDTCGKQQCMDSIVSVIIPVYNVAPYLREALESVVQQTYSSLQVLIVDDGSTDGSSAICDEYASKPSVTVIHQENGGLSQARNVGLDCARGEYIVFLDPDDAFHPRFIEVLMDAVKRDAADIAMCRYAVYTASEKLGKRKKWQINPPQAPGKYNREESFRALIDGKMNMSVWNRIYRSVLWKSIRFPVGRNYEDIDTVYRVLDLCRTVSMTDQVLYFHRKRPGSITHTLTRKNLEDRTLALSHLEEFVRLHTPGIFQAAQFIKIRQAVLNGLIASYARRNTITDKAELRRQIIALGESEGTEQLGLRTKTAYRMICSCPWLLKLLYPVYHAARMAVMQVTGR